jgi:hypothetical protein
MIERVTNWLGNWRVDVPHLRALESSAANDADVSFGQIVSGSQALVVKGFTISTAGAIGAQGNTLTMLTAGSVLMNENSSEAGTYFAVPDNRAPEVLNSTTNPNVFGTFVNSRSCYVGVDLLRSADNTTSDLVEFLSADTLLESGQVIPLARTLNYRIIISTSDFSSQPNVTPVAIVTTNSTGAVTNIQDARNMAFRLAPGGTLPNSRGSYPWPQGRSENLSGNVFSGGDKGIASIWESTQAVMTRLWEVGGGQYWYSSARTVDVHMTRLLADRFSNGDNFIITGGNLYWQGLRFVFANALGIAGDSYQGLPVYYNDVAPQTTSVPGLTDLVDGDCLYVDLDQTTVHDNAFSSPNGPLIAQKGILASMGTPTIPGSRFIIAWATSSGIWTRDSTYQVGAVYSPASTTGNGVVTLNQTPFSSIQPVVVVANAAGAAIATGLSRGNGSNPFFAPGALSIAGGVDDTLVYIGDSTGSLTNQTVDLGFGQNGLSHSTNVNGNSINIGIASTTPVITVGAGAGDSTTLQSVTINLTGASNQTTNLNAFSGSASVPTGSFNLWSNLTGGSGASGNLLIGDNNSNLWTGRIIIGDAVADSYSPPAQSFNIITLSGGINIRGTPFSFSGGSFSVAAPASSIALSSFAGTIGFTVDGGTINIGNEAFSDTINIGEQAAGVGPTVNVNASDGGNVNIANAMGNAGQVIIGNTNILSMKVRGTMGIQASTADYSGAGGINLESNGASGNRVHIQADVEVDPGHGVPTVSASGNTAPFTGGGAPTLALYTNAVSSNHGRLAITLNGATINTAGATQGPGGWTIATVTFGRVNNHRDQGLTGTGAGPFVILGNPCGVIGVSEVIAGTGTGTYSVDVPYVLSTVPVYTSNQLSGFKININFAWSLFVTGATFSNFTITSGVLPDIYWSVV